MIPTLLIDTKNEFSIKLNSYLKSYCPQIEVLKIVHEIKEAIKAIKALEPELVFLDIPLVFEILKFSNDFSIEDLEIILIANQLDRHEIDIKGHPTGILLRPIKLNELMLLMQFLQAKIQWKRIQLDNRKVLNQLLTNIPPNDLITIPTIEGLEFLKIEEIIRCEGLQKYTHVITTEKSDIISSYSIGQFCSMLESYGFFSSHKSHLINLRFIRKFLHEGTVIMRDGSAVPVSRRRKATFIERVKRLKPN